MRVLTNHHSADGVFLRRQAKALIQEFHITTRLGHLEATRVAVLALVAKHAAENLLIAQGQRNRSKNKGGKPSIARIAALERRQTAADERYETALVRLRDLAASSQRVAEPARGDADRQPQGHYTHSAISPHNASGASEGSRTR